jgi:hypothetical protein
VKQFWTVLRKCKENVGSGNPPIWVYDNKVNFFRALNALLGQYTLKTYALASERDKIIKSALGSENVKKFSYDRRGKYNRILYQDDNWLHDAEAGFPARVVSPLQQTGLRLNVATVPPPPAGVGAVIPTADPSFPPLKGSTLVFQHALMAEPIFDFEALGIGTLSIQYDFQWLPQNWVTNGSDAALWAFPVLDLFVFGSTSPQTLVTTFRSTAPFREVAFANFGNPQTIQFGEGAYDTKRIPSEVGIYGFQFGAPLVDLSPTGENYDLRHDFLIAKIQSQSPAILQRVEALCRMPPWL